MQVADVVAGGRGLGVPPAAQPAQPPRDQHDPHQDAAPQGDRGPVPERDVGEDVRDVDPAQHQRRNPARRLKAGQLREHRHHHGRDDEPPGEVGDRDAGDARQRPFGGVPDPVTLADHLRVEEQIPRGEQVAAEQGRRPPRTDERLHGQQAGVGHHRPRHRDHQRHPQQRHPERVGVVVGPEQQPRGRAEGLDRPADPQGGGQVSRRPHRPAPQPRVRGAGQERGGDGRDRERRPRVADREGPGQVADDSRDRQHPRHRRRPARAAPDCSPHRTDPTLPSARGRRTA